MAFVQFRLILAVFCVGLITELHWCHASEDPDKGDWYKKKPRFVGVGDYEANSVEAEAPNVGCSNPADIVFVLDESGSIYGPDFKKQLTFVQRVIETFDIRYNKTHIGVITFGNNVRNIFHLGQYFTDAEYNKAVQGITQARGETYTDLAIKRMREEMFASNRARTWTPHIGIVITDGESNFPDRTAREAALARADGIELIAIGVGVNVNVDELRAIASDAGRVFQADSYAALDELREKLAYTACHVTTLAPPTLPPPPQMIEGCTGSQAMDHIWALSDQADAAENNQALDLIKDVTSRMTIGPDRVQVGLSPRLCQAGPAIRLKDHDTTAGAIAAFDRRRIATTSQVEQHIKYIYKQGMTTENGARADTARFGVLIVDGKCGKRLSQTVAEANKAKEAGIRLIVVGVGDVDESELNRIASSSSDVLTVDSYDSIGSLGDDIVNRLCHGLIAGERPQRRRIYTRRYYNLYEY